VDTPNLVTVTTTTERDNLKYQRHAEMIRKGFQVLPALR
jgi:hypothetical protein